MTRDAQNGTKTRYDVPAEEAGRTEANLAADDRPEARQTMAGPTGPGKMEGLGYDWMDSHHLVTDFA